MPSPRRRALLSAALLAAATTAGVAHAQTPVRFQRLAHERGLSNPTVETIAQDARGFLWFGTQDGLNLYDGTGFTVFRPVPGDTTSLASAWIHALAPSRDGSIWVSVRESGVHRLDVAGNRSRRYRHDPDDSTSLASDHVNTMLEASDGTLWVGTHAGLDALDTASGKARHFYPSTRPDSTQFTNDVLALLEVPGGPLWVGTRLGVYLLDRATGAFSELPVFLLTREIRDMVLDTSGVVWIGAYDDLVAVDSRTLRVVRRFERRPRATHPLVADGINAMARAADGTIWIGTNNGILELDPVTANFRRHRPDARDPRSLPGPIVRSLLFDRGGVLWVGHESYGLAKHAPSAVAFRVLRKDSTSAHSLSDSYIRGIAEDRRHNIWIATQHGGLNRIDARTGAVRTFRHRPGDPRSLPGDNVWAFLEDRTGVMWVGTHTAGLGTFDPATGTFTRSRAVPDNASVNVLYEDKAGNLFVGLEGIGLAVLSPDRNTVRRYGLTFGERRILVGNDVQSILEDSRGILWIGGSDGLTRMDPRTERVTHYRGDPTNPSALRSSFVTHLLEDSRGWLWVATKGGGLSRYNPTTDTFTTYGPAERLPHSFIYGVLEDASGRLWLSSDDGIAMFDPRSDLVTRYGLEDGLQAREFNRRALYRAADGRMFFGGINGVNVFNPDAAAPAASAPDVRFVTVEGGNVRRSAMALTADSVVRLRHDASSVTISFAALDFSAPEKVQYAYQLEGVDREWVMAGNRTQATYAGLSPGRRVFRVRAASPAGTWSTQDAAVTLLVTPAWWATWWAYALQALVLAGAVMGIVRLRLRSARIRGRELEQRVEEQTRDLVTAHDRLQESLALQSATAAKLSEVTAAVPGAVFELHERTDGTRAFDFVSQGIAQLCRGAKVATAEPREAASALLSRIHPDDQAVFEDALAASRATLDMWRVDVRWTPWNGADVRWLTIQARAARHVDGGTVWTGVMTDATDARDAEEERMALESRMLQAQKEESLAILAGGVAHDFNNVLVSVVMGAELLQPQVAGDERAADIVRRIHSAGQRATELTQQMLAYTGKGQIMVEPVNVTALAEDMLSLLRTAIPRTIDLVFQADARSAMVEADATQLRQVVLNLVTNAGEAIGDKPGRIVVRVDVVSLSRAGLTLLHASPSLPERGPYVLVEVADNGSGMPPSLLERIFDPFFTTKFTGRGLGLAALLGIVRAHRGGLNVVTAPRQGTRFQIYLPRAEVTSVIVPTSVPAPAVASERQRVLIADDERDVAEIARTVLTRLGYDVVLAANGEEALTLGGAGDLDVILLDVMMPKMNGAATAHELRARGVRTPIVLMSGYAEEELIARGLASDADGFLKKPFRAAELSTAIRDAIATRRVG